VRSAKSYLYQNYDRAAAGKPNVHDNRAPIKTAMRSGMRTSTTITTRIRGTMPSRLIERSKK